MTRSRREFATLVGGVLLVSAGCLSGSGPPDDIDDELTADDVLEGIEAVETYTFESSTTLDTPDGELTVASDGAIDERNERMRVSTTVDGELGLDALEDTAASPDDGTDVDDGWFGVGESVDDVDGADEFDFDEIDGADVDLDETGESGLADLVADLEGGADAAVTVEQYVVDGTYYVQQFGIWTSIDLPDEGSLESDQYAHGGFAMGQDADPQQDLLAAEGELLEAVDLEPVGTETVEGVETVVLELDATDEHLANASASTGSDVGLEEFDGAVSEATHRLYVDPETSTLHKSEQVVSTTVDGESIELTTETTFADHDEPVDIELPAGAEQAVSADWFVP